MKDAERVFLDALVADGAISSYTVEDNVWLIVPTCSFDLPAPNTPDTYGTVKMVVRFTVPKPTSY
jgi:hypothetical protein